MDTWTCFYVACGVRTGLRKLELAALFVRASDPRGRGERESGDWRAKRPSRWNQIKSNETAWPRVQKCQSSLRFCWAGGRVLRCVALLRRLLLLLPGPGRLAAAGPGRQGELCAFALLAALALAPHWLARGRNKKKKKRTGQATSFQTNRRLGLALGPSHLIHRPPP